MGGVLRREKRGCMLGATGIFLTFDDKAGRKLLRFKCDTPGCSDAKGRPMCFDAKGKPTCFDAQGKDEPTMLSYGARHGIVGCLPARAFRKELKEYEQDYAVRTTSDVVALLRRMLTPAGEPCDEASTREVFRKVRGVCVDGQLLKTAQEMQLSEFPNIIIIMRDPAHIIRISCRDPLHDADVFKEQYQRLFASKGAVLKDLQNSHVWKEQFMACQRQILEEGGKFGGDLSKCLRDMQYIQPRFESFVTPRRRYVCLVRPIAMLLAVKAGDARQLESVRKAADHALTSMSDARDIFAAGLAGDYGEVCLEFLRIFDVHDHDPGTTARQVEDFTRGLRLLFVDGHIVCAPDGAGSASTPGSASTSAAPGSVSTSAAPGSASTPATLEPRSKTGTCNVADVGTKHLEKATFERCLRMLGLQFFTALGLPVASAVEVSYSSSLSESFTTCPQPRVETQFLLVVALVVGCLIMFLGLMLGFILGKYVYERPIEPESEPPPVRGSRTPEGEAAVLPADAGGAQDGWRAAGGDSPETLTNDESLEFALLQREVSWMRSQLFDVAVPDLFTSPHGQCFHVHADCRGLRGAAAVRRFRGCRHCAMWGLDERRRREESAQ